MRSIYYIATVISVYRNLIDKIRTNTNTLAYTKYCLDILNRCANRDSTPQFFDKLPGCILRQRTIGCKITNNIRDGKAIGIKKKSRNHRRRDHLGNYSSNDQSSYNKSPHDICNSK